MTGGGRGLTIICRLFKWVRYASGITASMCIFFMVCTIVPDSLGRSFFNRPIYGTLELNMLLMSAIVFLGLSWAQAQRAHVRVEILLTKAGPKLQSAMNLFAWLLAFILFALITVGGVEEAFRSLEFGENLWGAGKMPLWPGKLVAAFGSGMLCIQLLLDMSAEIINLFSGPSPPHQTVDNTRAA